MARSILLAAGHATSPRAAGTQANGYKEEELTLELRDLIEPILRSFRLDVATDGARGVSRPLTEAIVLAKRYDIAVELHFNAGTASNTGPVGMSTPSRKQFATDLAKAVGSATGLPLHSKGWLSETKSQHGQLGFCRRGRGVVLEVCFQSNKKDMEVYLASKAKVATAIAEVLKRYAETTSRIYDDSLPDEPIGSPARARPQTTGSRKRVGRPQRRAG
jgi:N-acetylmuramoyl-L-alanine amidase